MRRARADLSGGNQQKVVVGRELGGHPKVVVAVQPTHGLDIGASANVHRRLSEARASGAAIVLISMDLDEVRSLFDRVSVMYEGRLADPLPVSAGQRGQAGSPDARADRHLSSGTLRSGNPGARGYGRPTLQGLRRKLVESPIGLSVASVLLALGVTLVVLAAMGKDPLGALAVMFEGGLGGRGPLGESLVKSSLLILTSLAVFPFNM